MAAKKKAKKKTAAKKSRKTPARKTPSKSKSTRKASRRKPVRIKAPPARPVARELPNDEAWRALIETAIEKPDPVGGKSAARK